MMLGVQKAQPKADTRLPIMKATIKLLVQSVRNECNKYSGCMFLAMYLLASHAFLVVGEFTVEGANSPHTLQLNQLKNINKRTGTTTSKNKLPFLKAC